MTAELPIDSIKVGDRHRRDLGDIKSLAASIDDVGLIHPVVVTPDHRLVAGERRLAAVRELGWDVVPVTVIHTLDEAGLVIAEQQENTCREDFTLTEAAAMRAAVAEVLAPVAEERRVEAGKRHGRGQRSKGGGKLPQPKTRDVAAKGTGYSGRTLDKVDEVVQVAESPDTPQPVREAARDAITEMNTTGNASRAHQKVTEAQQVHDAVAEFPDLRHYVDTGRPADAIRLANALRGYAEPELSVRIDALRKTIAAEQAGRLPLPKNGGPDYAALAQKMFLAANAAAQTIETSGGTHTFEKALLHADPLTIATWRGQFESLAEKCQALARVCAPKLRAL